MTNGEWRMVLAEEGKAPEKPAAPGKPGTKPAQKSVEERVREIVVEQLGVKPEAVTLKARLREDLKADDLDMLEMLVSYKEQFDVHIPTDVAEKFVTVGDVVTYLKKVVK